MRPLVVKKKPRITPSEFRVDLLNERLNIELNFQLHGTVVLVLCGVTVFDQNFVLFNWTLN